MTRSITTPKAIEASRAARHRTHQAHAATCARRRYQDAVKPRRTPASATAASLASQSFPEGSLTTTLKPGTIVRPASPGPPKQQSPRRSR